MCTDQEVVVLECIVKRGDPLAVSVDQNVPLLSETGRLKRQHRASIITTTTTTSNTATTITTTTPTSIIITTTTPITTNILDIQNE